MLVLELGSHIAGSDKKRVCCVLRFAVRNPEKDRLLAWIGCGCEGCEEGCDDELDKAALSPRGIRSAK
jgi:hypothetical protein